MRRARTTAIALAALLAVSTVASTHASSAHAASPVRLDVVDRETGEWLADHAHRGDRWIAGTPGHRYGVRLTNTSGERVLVVLSVDGVNAVTGETAHPSQAGYVLAPWQSTEIAGWRKSQADVAQFVFTDLGDSYAARTGRPDNVGTIGIAVFREAGYRRPPVSPPITRGDAGRAARGPAADAAAPAAAAGGAYAHAEGRAQSIGTGHGEREWSPVSSTTFHRGGRAPVQVTQLRYDDVARLVALGVLPRERHRPWRAPTPQAFPDGFVADPPPRW